MHFSLSSISSFLLFTTAVSSSLTITIPPSTLLPNPNVLTAGTHATLTTSNPIGHLTAPLTRSATFVFRNLNLQPQSQTQSYLLDIRSAEYVFAPFRVDVAADGRVLGVWETFRGNPWDNRGTEKYNVVVDGVATTPAEVEDVRVDARVVAKRGFYEQRAKCRFLPCLLCTFGRFDCAGPCWVGWYGVNMANVCSLAVVAANEPDDSSCCRGFGVHIWDAEAYGKQ